MKKSLGVLLTSAIITSTAAEAQQIRSWSGYKANVNCGLPKRDSMRVLPNGNLRVILRDGDKGKCRTDPKPWHTPQWFKPYSERAELVIRKRLRDGREHHISFEAKWMQGYLETGRNENIFQIKGCESSGQVAVLAFLRRAARNKEFMFYVGSQDTHTAKAPFGLHYDTWFKFDIYYRNGPRNSNLTVKMNGKPIVENIKFRRVKTCGNNRLRLGLYRGGSPDGRKLKTTEVEYRNLKIK